MSFTWLVGGCGPVILAIGTAHGDQRLQSTVVESDGGWFPDRVAVVDVSGLIVNSRRRSVLREGENPVSLLAEKLRQAERDRRVRAVILRLNTPGGTVTASDAMYREVMRFRQRTGKPVIALMMDVAASGGYYLACSADRIVAYPTTVTGSIGVIMQTISVKPALNRLGVETKALTTGPNKDAGSPLSELTPEQEAVLQSLVDDFYDRFRQVVKDARPDIPTDRFDELTDGRVLSGDQAVTAGVVDQLGDLHDAFSLAKQMAGLSRAELVLYHRPLQYVGSAYAHTPIQPEAGSDQTQINLVQFNMTQPFNDAPVAFWYLWQP